MNAARQLRRYAPVFGAIICLASGASPAMAGEPIAIAWTATHKGDKFEVMLDDKRVGRLVFFFTNHTTDRQIKGGNLIDGNNRMNSGYWDLTQGRGRGNGFAQAEKGGDAYMLEWDGTCYPVSGTDGKPVTRCGGGWYFVPGSGTGRYANIGGGGTWRGVVLPSGDFEEEGNGFLEQ